MPFIAPFFFCVFENEDEEGWAGAEGNNHKGKCVCVSAYVKGKGKVKGEEGGDGWESLKDFNSSKGPQKLKQGRWNNTNNSAYLPT